MKISTKRLFRLILTVITLSTGVIVLLSFVIENEPLVFLRGVFVEWTVIVVSFAMLLGVANVLRVHAQRIHNRQGGGYSLILILAFLAVFIPGILIGPKGEIVDLIRDGYRDMNQLKAALRVGMGACGGKTCQELILRLFREEGVDLKEVTPLVERPLEMEVPLRVFAGATDEESGE